MSSRREPLLWVSFGLICLLQLSSIEGRTPTVQITNGTLLGSFMKSRLGREFVGFRGIPYAMPPLGKLRFEPPKPVEAWDGVKSAQEDAGVCTQRNVYTHDEEIVGVEDCLYLNVYTPRLPSEEEKPKNGFPIMIWFHGGGWLAGTGHSENYHPKFLLDHDLILVTVNYRLGPLGFLSTEDTICPGNQGMKDQVQSIRWVQENIAAFGGDPNRVTIFGESAGGASVHYHMMSPLSRGLFHRAISQSGNSHCPWTLTRPGHAKEKAKTVGKLLDCPFEHSKDLVECLRTKNADDIIGTDRAFLVFDYCPMIPFRPVIEPAHPGAFLLEDPAVSSHQGHLLDIPWMTGITSEEGSLRVPGLYGTENGKWVKELNDDFTKIAPITFLYDDTCPESLKDKVSENIRRYYFGDRPIDNSTKFDLIDLYSDSWFNHAAHKSVRDYFEQQSSPVYYYYFAYRGSSSFSRIFGDPTQDYGVSHADDLQYLFPVGEQLFKDTPLSKEDNKMIDVMTTLWYNFANSGNPTPKVSKILPVKWKPVRSHALEYLHIGKSKIYMSDNLNPERTKFWESLPIRLDLQDSKKVRQEERDEL